MAKDGIIIKARARVTVRTNLDRFVGGATEETIIARVGEGIVTTIGTANSYKDVLENPDRISKTVLDKALDSNTAFEILSIDIADVFVGENVGAKLQAEQAEANKLSPRPRRKSAAPPPWLSNRKCSPAFRKCARASSKPRRRCRWPWPRPSAPGIWASWIITA